MPSFKTIYKLTSFKTISVCHHELSNNWHLSRPPEFCHYELSNNWLLLRPFMNWLLSRSSEFVMMDCPIIGFFQDHLNSFLCQNPQKLQKSMDFTEIHRFQWFSKSFDVVLLKVEREMWFSIQNPQNLQKSADFSGFCGCPGQNL